MYLDLNRAKFIPIIDKTFVVGATGSVDGYNTKVFDHTVNLRDKKIRFEQSGTVQPIKTNSCMLELGVLRLTRSRVRHSSRVDVCGHFRLLGSLKNKDNTNSKKKSDVAVATSRPKMYHGDAAYQLAKKTNKTNNNGYTKNGFIAEPFLVT